MRAIKSLLAMGFAMVAITACDDDDSSGNSPAKPIVLTETQQNISKSLQNFSWNMMEKLSAGKQNDNNNLVFSPLSLNTDLAMLLNGAQGEGLQQMLDQMQLSGYEIDNINQYFKTLSKGIYEADKSTQFSSANSFWYLNTYSVEPTFKQPLSEFYNCEFYATKGDNSSVSDINNWCDNRTNGRIKEIIQEFSSTYYLINAVYFRSRWSAEMKKCGKETFTQASGATSEVEMFKNTNNTGSYLTTPKYSATILPYSNGAFGMFFILPNEGVSLREIYADLKSSDVDLVNMVSSINITVKVPIFEIENKLDLSNLIDFPDKDLFVFKDVNSAALEIMQVANIIVNEEGTEAAAVTFTGDTAFEPLEPIYFTLNRPFIFGIIECSTGTPLFLGEINKL